MRRLKAPLHQNYISDLFSPWPSNNWWGSNDHPLVANCVDNVYGMISVCGSKQQLSLLCCCRSPARWRLTSVQLYLYTALHNITVTGPSWGVTCQRYAVHQCPLLTYLQTHREKRIVLCIYKIVNCVTYKENLLLCLDDQTCAQSPSTIHAGHLCIMLDCMLKCVVQNCSNPLIQSLPVH